MIPGNLFPTCITYVELNNKHAIVIIECILYWGKQSRPHILAIIILSIFVFKPEIRADTPIVIDDIIIDLKIGSLALDFFFRLIPNFLFLL